jgi:hypothetical protein
MSTTHLPTFVSDAYELLKWLVDHVGKFPRSHRFVLGKRWAVPTLRLINVGQGRAGIARH